MRSEEWLGVGGRDIASASAIRLESHAPTHVATEGRKREVGKRI